MTQNALYVEVKKRKREKIEKKFPALEACEHDHYLALYKYIANCPQCFFNEIVYKDYSLWLEKRDMKNRGKMRKYIEEHMAEFNKAFLHLEEINLLEWHDSVEKFENFELIRFIDQKIHPSYLRLVEAVMHPFLHMVAFFSRLDRGKSTDGLDIWNVIEELKKESIIKTAVIPYCNSIRNGIAHGGVTYLQKEIKYKDKKGNEDKYFDTDIVKIFDNLLDVCNALALGMSVFYLKHLNLNYELPQQLLVEELKAETECFWWNIVGCTPSEFSGLNQLVIYAQSNTYDKRKINTSVIQTGILAEYFAPSYSRYFVSIRSSKMLPGWAAFDGNKLSQLRTRAELSIDDYKGVVEDDLIFLVNRFKLPSILEKLIDWFNVPSIISKINTYFYCIKLIWYVLKEDFRKIFARLNIIISEAEIHRNGGWSILNGKVYIEDDDISQELIAKLYHRIIKKSLLHSRKQLSIFNLVRYLPLGHAQINVYRKKYRRRTLDSLGLSSDHICRVRVERISRIKSLYLLDSEIEKKGCYTIEWNKAWLEREQ